MLMVEMFESQNAFAPMVLMVSGIVTATDTA